MVTPDGTVAPPCLESPDVQRALHALEGVLARELPDTIVAVTWASGDWQRHEAGKGKSEVHLAKDPWPQQTRRIYCSVGGVVIDDREGAHDALQERYGPGFRQRETTEQLVIGTYWTRFYVGFPEPEKNRGGKCQPAEPPEGGFRSILKAVPEAEPHALALATAMQQHYQQTKIGCCLVIIPPGEANDVVSAGWTFQNEVSQH